MTAFLDERIDRGTAGIKLGRDMHDAEAALAPILADVIVGTASAIDDLLIRANVEHEAVSAKREAWIADPILMLRELHANLRFVTQNPDATLYISGPCWQLYIDVLTHVLKAREP